MRRPLRTVLTLAIIGGLTAACFGGTDEAKGGSLAQNASLSGLTVTVGGKEFTEQLVLCQMTALALRSAGATVKEKCGLQGSNTTRQALTTGSIDMYWEYTGTAWVNYLKHTDAIKDPAALYDTVAREDLDRNQVQWLAAAPANNTYAIVVRTPTGADLHVASLSDYARLVRANAATGSMCVAAEFAGRDDGLPGQLRRSRHHRRPHQGAGSDRAGRRQTLLPDLQPGADDPLVGLPAVSGAGEALRPDRPGADQRPAAGPQRPGGHPGPGPGRRGPDLAAVAGIHRQMSRPLTAICVQQSTQFVGEFENLIHVCPDDHRACTI
jgi:hypothetical protein